jgi:hypothetical protein
MTGSWGGNVRIESIFPGLTFSTVCVFHFTVDTSNGPQFAGKWQSSVEDFDPVPLCEQQGTFNGTVSSMGAVSGVSLNTILARAGCTRVAGDGAFSGALNVGSQLTLQMSETIRCSGQPDEKRQLSLSMLKQ